MELTLLHPNPFLLAGAVVLDLLIGDPVYALHPIRLMGRTLSWLENGLRKLGADGYGGGITLFFLLSIIWVGGTSAVLFGLQKWSRITVIHLSCFPGVFLPRTSRPRPARMGRGVGRSRE